MTKQVHCSASTLMNQAPMTAELYLQAAITAIDKALGDGYAKKNPALISAFLQTCALDFGASLITSALESIAER